jgi:STE24 endopeptidase
MSIAVSDEPSLDSRGREYRRWQQVTVIPAIGVLYIVFGAWNWTGAAGWFDDRFQSLSEYPFAVAAAIAISVSLALPYIAYQASVLIVEKKFGFLRMGFQTSAVKILKAALYTTLVITVSVVFLAWSFLLAPDWWWLLVPGGLFLWRVAQTNLYPEWLRLFYSVHPLKDPLLRAQLRRLEERIQLPIKSYRVIQINAITSKANAWVSGIRGAHAVLLTDTLIETYSAEEVEAVVAHELGHVKHHDVLKRLGFLGVLELGGFLLLNWASSALFEPNVDSLLDTALFTFWVGGVLLYSRLLLIRPMRQQELRADEFALSNCNPAAFSSAMRKLKLMNLVTYDKKEESKFSHPAMDERIRRADELAAKQAAGSSD